MTENNELHWALAQMQVLMRQAADRLTHFVDELAKSHTVDGVIEDVAIQLILESDADLIDAMRTSAETLDQRQKPAPQNECLCKDKCLHAGAMGQCKGLPSVLAAPAQEPVAGSLKDVLKKARRYLCHASVRDDALIQHCPALSPNGEKYLQLAAEIKAYLDAQPQEPWEHHAKKLTQWLHCMSHNDSYFGEPAGLVKQVTGELNRLIDASLQPAKQEPEIEYCADYHCAGDCGQPHNQNEMREFLTAAPQPAQQQEPMGEGWKLVPVDPTMEMIAALGFDGDVVMAIGHASICKGIEDAYAAMLNAAPQPAQQERCHLCDCTGDIHSPDGEWRGECPYCKQPEPDIGNPISTQREPVDEPQPDGVVIGFTEDGKALVDHDGLEEGWVLYTSPPPAQPQHPDDQAVDRFAAAMKEKLANAREKGRSGWQTCTPENLSRMLREHVEKGDPRDVANFCMMLWNLSAGITASQQPTPVQQPLFWYRPRSDGGYEGPIHDDWIDDARRNSGVWVPLVPMDTPPEQRKVGQQTGEA